MEMIVVKFTKQFVKGSLTGIEFKDQIRYPKSSEARVASQFASNVESGKVIKECIGCGAYKISQFEIVH